MLLFRYKSVKANAFSRKEMEAAAHRQANKLSYKDPMITCDYCGAKIDTRKHKVCPQCGAAFDQDLEWTERHDAGDAFIDAGTRKIIEEREKKSQEESQKILGKIKRTILLLVAIIVGLIVLGVVALQIDKQTSYRRSETLDDSYRTKGFIPADYKVDGDGVIFDQNGMRIRVTGFYVEPDTREGSFLTDEAVGDVAVEFLLENHTDSDYKVAITSESFNGITFGTGSGFFTYDSFKKGDDVVFYETLNDVPLETITEIYFEDIHMYNGDSSDSMKLEAPAMVRTTAKKVFEPDLKDVNLVFTNDYVDIYAKVDADYDKYYNLFIRNKTDRPYLLTGEDNMYVDGKMYEASSMYQQLVPAGYLYASESTIYPRNTGEEEVHLTGREVEIGIAFRCEEDPRYDFSTGYIDISKPIETEEE
ncbi:MAG: hypothetical protein J6Z06_03095 [Lachnospiraceae bacterium]|nr:hypothetical protein [Lachnospiraceae bacterium]